MVRAAKHPAAPALREALRHVRQTTGLMILGAVVFAALAGAAAARAALLAFSSGRVEANGAAAADPVNFYWALLTILGLQTLILIIWIFLMIWSGRRTGRGDGDGGGSLALASSGGLLLRGAQSLAARLHRGPHHAAAAAASAAANLRGDVGRWTVSSVSNGLWLTFNAACLVVLALLLSARQYAFGWETTLLSREAYVPLTRAIGALPRAAGFLTPSDEQVAHSQWKSADFADDAETRQAWSGLLVGCVVVYGFGPRVLLLGLSLGMRRRARDRYRLDLTRPAFMSLQQRLMPLTSSLGVVDADEARSPDASRPPEAGFDPRSAPASAPRPARPLGSAAVIGFEIDPPAGIGWPPVIHGVRWSDLGIIDGRDDQRRSLDRLRNDAAEPESLVLVCSLAAAPDRGVGAFIDEARRSVTTPTMLLLTGGESMRRRGEGAHIEQRVADWRDLAARSGLDAAHVAEIDLDHLTQATAARLAAFARGDGSFEPHRTRLIERAFDQIAQEAARWIDAGRAPKESEAAALHRSISQIYGSERLQWARLLQAPLAAGGDIGREMRHSADRMVLLLPERLKRSSKWLAAGAAAGALGCVAAAGFIAPAAIASLPLWSAIGAAAAAAAQPNPRPRSDSDRAIDSADSQRLGQAVRAAALFAILLELQGLDEPSITASLDDVIAAEEGEDDLEFRTAVQARAWLDAMRHRLDVSCANGARRGASS